MKHSLLVPALALCSLQASAGDWHSEVTTAIESGKFKEAKAIMNAKVGEVRSVESPNGTYDVEIVEIL